ncbi:8992_t:CDS:2, partial [Racocetra persica]
MEDILSNESFSESSSRISLIDITTTTISLDNNQFKEPKLRGGSQCNHIIETDSGTGNFSDHLQNKHSITKFGKRESDVSQLTNNKKLYQIKNNTIYKEQVDKALVEYIVTDSQPFYILENPRFIKYSLALGPSYKLSSNKGIKSKIYLAYDWMLATIHTQALLNYVVCNNINKNHEYLQAIPDVVTRWDSTYLAWVQVLKLKPAIEIMQVILSHNNDPTTKKDARHFKRIILTPNEWQLIDNLVKILQPFANTTKMLGGSKYTTMSYMFPA